MPLRNGDGAAPALAVAALFRQVRVTESGSPPRQAERTTSRVIGAFDFASQGS
jgi:hypothetical protein